MNDDHNGAGPNGSGNGHDKEEAQEETVLRFPTLAERDRLRRERLEEEKRQGQAAQPKSPPFLNIGKITPFARFLVVAIWLVHLPLYLLFDSGERLEAFYVAGFVPGYFTGALDGFPWYAPLGVITHIFIHGGWMHVVFNTVMGLALGIFFERAFGPRTTALFFFACGIAGALFYFLLAPFATVPVVGASGAISGFFAAVIMMLHEQGQMGPIGRRGPWPILGFWLIFMVLVGFLSGENMAWQAHIGGFVAGAGLYYLLRTGRIRF